MPIPDDDTLQRDLLVFLANEPENRADVWRVYEQLALLHPEVTESERTEKYQNSASLWANRVQFARLHLANSGLLYRANATPDAPRSVWKLTPSGYALATSLINHSKKGPITRGLTASIKADFGGIVGAEENVEGSDLNSRLVACYEQNQKLRSEAIYYHGTACKACGFSFTERYGELGHNYIEVHHLVPISVMIDPGLVNPKTDMTVLCSNCHSMIHGCDSELRVNLEQLS